LRREAGRLCPQGGEILRQAGRNQLAEKIDGRMQRWLNDGSEWFDPPQRAAQLVVLCNETRGGHLIAAADLARTAAVLPDLAASAASPAAEAPALAVPIGPVSVEW
jgi:hypothetical protein